MNVRSNFDVSMSKSNTIEETQTTRASTVPSSQMPKIAEIALSSVQSNGPVMAANSQRTLGIQHEALMGKLQLPSSLVESKKSEAWKSLDRSFQGAPVACQDGNGAVRALTVGIQWANGLVGVMEHFHKAVPELVCAV